MRKSNLSFCLNVGLSFLLSCSLIPAFAFASEEDATNDSPSLGCIQEGNDILDEALEDEQTDDATLSQSDDEFTDTVLEAQADEVDEEIAILSDADFLIPETTIGNYTYSLLADGTLTIVRSKSGTLVASSWKTIMEAATAKYSGRIRVVLENITKLVASTSLTSNWSPSEVCELELYLPEGFDASKGLAKDPFVPYGAAEGKRNIHIVGVSGPGASPYINGNFLVDPSTSLVISSLQTEGAVVVPEGIEKVSPYSFYGRNYTSLSLPASLIEISDNPFSYTNTFDSITVASGNSKYETCKDDFVRFNDLQEIGGTRSLLYSRMNAPGTYVDGSSVVYSSDRTQLIKAPTTLSGAYVIDPACTTITESAFSGCTLVTEVSGSAVKTIGASAFSGCSALCSIEFPVLANIGNYAFKGTSVASYTAPATLSGLGTLVFDGASLSSVDLSATKLATIPALGSSVLENFVFPTTVKSLSALRGCTKLANVDLTAYTQLSTVSLGGCASLTTVNLPTSVTSLSLANCTSLTTFSVPSQVTSLSFSGCTALKTLDLSFVKMATLPADIFSGCSNLESVVLPTTLTSITSTATSSPFRGCTKLKSVDLCGLRMTTIPYGLFDGCSSLETIGWPQGLQSIAPYAFQNAGLKNVTIPEGVTLIDTGAFMGCDKLTQVELPNTLRTIGTFAFCDCKELVSVNGLNGWSTLPLSVIDIKAAAFSNTKIEKLVLPALLYSGIRYDAPTWSGDSDGTWGGGQIFTSTVAAELGKTIDANSHVDYWSNVTSVDLSQYQQNYLPPYFFMGLNKMTEATLPSNVSILSTGAFFGCEALKDLYIYNQNIRIAGAGTTGDSSLGWSSMTMPSISHWKYTGSGESYTDPRGWEVVPIEGIKLHGLAYASNDLIAYADKTNCTFVPFVVLDNFDSKSTFGYDVYGYNEVQGVPESLEFTGTDLMGQIAPKIHFTDAGVPDSYDIDLTTDTSRLTYQVTDAAGNAVSQVVDPGTYTVKIAGVAGSRDVFGTKQMTVTVAHTPTDLAVTGNVASADAALAMSAVSGDTLAALGSPASATALKAALDAATHRVDISHVSSGTAYEDVVNSVGSGTLGMAFDVNYFLNDVQVHNGFGTLTVTIGVPDAAKGHWVTLHHRHNDGSITTQNLRCPGSTLTFTVSDLSTFALEIGALLNPTQSGGGTTTVYRTVYQPATTAAPLAFTGKDVVAADTTQAKGPAPDIAYGGNADGLAGQVLDWLPLLIAALLVLAAAGAVTWFLLARKRSKDQEGQAAA